MKYSVQRKVILNLTMDSSEVVMFNRGGMHKINVNTNRISCEDPDYELEITIQLERDQQARHDFVTGEASKNRSLWDQINKGIDGNETKQTGNT